MVMCQVQNLGISKIAYFCWMEISELMLGYFLTEGLLDHFDILGIEHCSDLARKETRYYIILEEKNNIPDGYTAEDYKSKGLLAEKLIQDFAIRGIPFNLQSKHSHSSGCESFFFEKSQGQ
jgi:hypothetical protein